MTDQSEVEVLAQTAEWLSRLADTIERVTDKMADKIAQLQAEQAEIRDGMLALSNRIESVARASGQRHIDRPAWPDGPASKWRWNPALGVWERA